MAWPGLRHIRSPWLHQNLHDLLDPSAQGPVQLELDQPSVPHLQLELPAPAVPHLQLKLYVPAVPHLQLELHVPDMLHLQLELYPPAVHHVTPPGIDEVDARSARHVRAAHALAAVHDPAQAPSCAAFHPAPGAVDGKSLCHGAPVQEP